MSFILAVDFNLAKLYHVETHQITVPQQEMRDERIPLELFQTKALSRQDKWVYLHL